MRIPTICWQEPPDGPAVVLLDQTRLPTEEVALCCPDVPALVAAIRRLVVRGAPALGVAGGFGVALAAVRGDDVAAAADALAAARPTAVNLSWGVRRVVAAYRRAVEAHGDAHGGAGDGAGSALAEARRIEAEDIAAAHAMARHGLALVPARARILTHCNTGRLVSAGTGTAFGVVAAAHAAGRVETLWVDETRPLLQGARLTAYEAAAAGIPHAVLVDGAAGSLFAAGKVDLVLVGADRIAADGSVANKVGTFALAVLARHHGIAFVVVAPCSTIDPATATGAQIVVEQRDAAEVTGWSPAYNPAFDVTPPELVSVLVTEAGVARPVDAASVAALLAAAGSAAGEPGPGSASLPISAAIDRPDATMGR